MPDFLVIVLPEIGPLDGWLLMGHLNKPSAGAQGGPPPAPLGT